MEWVNLISRALDYIEENITDDIKLDDVANSVYISPFYFQKGFSMLCGITLSEYIRNRKLSLAGGELSTTNISVIDVALKYGYESPDSFTKAFTRFHGITPSMAKKDNIMIKSFTPLRIKISIEGGNQMDYKIVKKEAFTVLGSSKTFKYETCKNEIPNFWKEHFQKGNGKYVSGMFGINIDEAMGSEEFEYLIADMYDSKKEVPDGFVTKTIPAFTWAMFSINGSVEEVFQDSYQRIFSEWLPALKEYEFAAGYCIEMYDDPRKYEKGTNDINYHSEIWIPIKKKS